MEMSMKKTLGSIVAAALVCSASLFAQDKQNNQGVDPAPLLKALKQLNGAQGFRLQGSVSKQEAEDDEGMGGGGMQVMMPGMGPEPFTGRFGVYRPEKGETLVTSKSDLPGFTLYELDEHRISRQTFEDAPAGVGQLGNDVSSLFSLQKVIRAVKRAKLEKQVDKASGTTTFKGQLTKRLIRAGGGGGGMMAMFAPKVLKVVGRWKIDAKGNLVEIRYEVQRTDPMAALQAKAMNGEQIDPSTAMEDMEDDETAGPTSVYTFKVKSGAPSKREANALKNLRKLAAA
jgi:hypothetical protein